MNITNFKRIIIVGNSGSGKSYLGKKIAEITDLPLIHLDNEFWKPNWVKTPRDEWIEIQKNLIKAEKWIIEGNYNSTMELRFEASDLVIFLDINRIVCMVSAIKRHGKKRSDLPEYLEEKFSGEFFNFCKRIWSFNKTVRKTIISLHGKYPEKPFLLIKKRSQLKLLLQS